MSKNKINGKRIAWHASIFCGTIISIWTAAAFLSGLAQVNWQVSELLRQYLIAVGLMQEFHTMSDFYTHIKGNFTQKKTLGGTQCTNQWKSPEKE